LYHQHQRSHIVTASTQNTFLYHRFILSVLCYSSFLHWYDGPIYMLRPSESLLANNQLTIIIEWFRINIASSPTINPIQGFSIIEISCLFLYWVKSFSFQIFNLFLRSEREFLWLNTFFFCVFQHLSNLPCTSVYCEYDQICKHANIQSVLGYSDKPFISAVKTIIDRSLYMMFTPSHATQPLGAC